MQTSLADALRELAGHQAVRSRIEVREGKGRTVAVFDVEVSLPSRALNDLSATGVRRLEPVFLVFPADFPLKAPSVQLRPDFPSNFAHINPHSPGDHVPPCIFEGDLSELMHRFGIEKILDQLLVWLKKAAEGQLLDLEQGWEPTRRGSPDASVEFDADALAQSLPKDGSILGMSARLFQVSGTRHLTLGRVDDTASAFSLSRVRDTAAWTGTMAVFIACAPWVGDKPQVFGTYAADTVVDLPSLLERATLLGIDAASLDRRLESATFNSTYLTPSSSAWPWPGDFCIAVILAAHRPVHLIGTHRQVEFVPYLVRVPQRPTAPIIGDAVVEPAWQIHRVSPRLLAATSGFAEADIQQQVTVAGCGSVGSKLSLHLARAGFGAQTLVDNELLSPHNMARHALLDHAGWNKAEKTREALGALGHDKARAVAQDVVAALTSEGGAVVEHVLPPATKLFIDTTASFRVAAAIAQSAHLSGMGLRVARAFLIGAGRAAVLMLEAPQRAVRIDDLYAHMGALCRTNPTLRAAIGGDGATATEVFVGDSCRSLTLSMPDSVVSRGAALLASQVQQWLVDGFPLQGQLLVGTAAGDGIGMGWHSNDVTNTHVLQATGDGGWSVRVAGTVALTLRADSEQWLPRETGGALLGHVDALSRTIYIADVVPAPEDSERSPEKFVLGTRGLGSALRRAHADSVGYLQYLGTWHSHPMGGPHSPTDFETLRRLASFAPGLPVVSLVWTASGMLCEVGRFNVN